MTNQTLYSIIWRDKSDNDMTLSTLVYECQEDADHKIDVIYAERRRDYEKFVEEESSGPYPPADFETWVEANYRLHPYVQELMVVPAGNRGEIND